MIDYDINLSYDKQLEFGAYGSSCAKDGLYAVRIDYRLSEHEQKKTFIHELLHIILGHFSVYCELTTAEKEKEVEEYMKECFYVLS